VSRVPGKEIDRAAIITAVGRAVGMMRTKRSPMQVYDDLYRLLGKTLIGPEQPLVSLCLLTTSYLLGEADYEALKELSEEYIEKLKQARGFAVRPEVGRLAMEAARLAEEREELKPIASFIQLYLSEMKKDFEAEEKVEVYSPESKSWLEILFYPNGYYEVKINGKNAPWRAAVQLGDGERREAPARFPVSSTDMLVHDIETLYKFDKRIIAITKSDLVIKVAKLGEKNKMRERAYAKRLLELLDEIKGKVIIVGFFDKELLEALRVRGIEVVDVHEKIAEHAGKAARRMLGEGADLQVLGALSILLMLYPQMARAQGMTRSEVAREASKILENELSNLDDDGFRFLVDVVKVMIKEKRIPREKIPDRMGRVARTLGLK
jgi:hypothetical protein